MSGNTCIIVLAPLFPETAPMFDMCLSTHTHVDVNIHTYVGGSKIFRTSAAICTAVVLAPSTGRW